MLDLKLFQCKLYKYIRGSKYNSAAIFTSLIRFSAVVTQHTHKKSSGEDKRQTEGIHEGDLGREQIIHMKVNTGG